MKYNAVNRQAHRWVSVTFTAISAAIFISLGVGVKPPQWIYYLPLLPLALLVITGVYMFVLPYVAKLRGFSVVPDQAGRNVR
jgi:hypothetical protein